MSNGDAVRLVAVSVMKGDMVRFEYSDQTWEGWPATQAVELLAEELKKARSETATRAAEMGTKAALSAVKMSDTPRTDAQPFVTIGFKHTASEVAFIEHARQLERELAEKDRPRLIELSDGYYLRREDVDGNDRWALCTNGDRVRVLSTFEDEFVNAALRVTPSAIAPRVEWYDEHGCHRSVTIAQAADELKHFYDEWPDGLNEIEASLQWHKRELERLKGTPSSIRAACVALKEPK